MTKIQLRKNFLRCVTLNVIGMLGLSCYILADTIFISLKLGNFGLTSLGLAISIFSVISASGLMLALGGGIRYRENLELGKLEEAQNIFNTTIKLALVLGLIFIVVGIFFSRPLAYVLGADADTIDMTATYLRVILIFAPLFMLNNIFICFARNANFTILAMTAMLTGSIANIILDYVFMFLLNMGMLGAVLATACAPLISMLCLLPYLLSRLKKFSFKYRMPKENLRIIRLGLPAFVTELACSIALIVFNLLILSLEGPIGVASYSIIANISLVILALFTGAAQGAQPLITTSFVHKDRASTNRLLLMGTSLCFVLGLFLYGLSNLLAPQIIGAFNSENNSLLYDLTRSGFAIYFSGFMCAGINIFLASHLSATNRSTSGFILSLMRGLIFLLPFAFIFSALAGLQGVWLAFTLSETVTSIVFIIKIIYDESLLKKIN